MGYKREVLFFRFNIFLISKWSDKLINKILSILFKSIFDNFLTPPRKDIPHAFDFVSKEKKRQKGTDVCKVLINKLKFLMRFFVELPIKNKGVFFFLYTRDEIKDFPSITSKMFSIRKFSVLIGILDFWANPKFKNAKFSFKYLDLSFEFKIAFSVLRFEPIIKQTSIESLIALIFSFE